MKKKTFSEADKGVPISDAVKIIQATVPSQEQAIKYKPSVCHDKSSTLSSKSSLITTKGRFKDVNQTLTDLSREPIAQQQYCCVFGLPGFNFFKIFELNLCKTIPLQNGNQNNSNCARTTHVTAFRCPTKSLSCFQPSRSIIWAVGPPPFMACADTKYCPSGDHDKRKTCVVALQSTNGSVITSCCAQSAVRHTRNVLSSD